MRSVRSRKSWTASEVGGCLLPDLVLEDSPPFCKYGRMRKTWLKEAGITDVSAFFSLENEKELGSWSDRFAAVTAKSYMRGYRDIYKTMGCSTD